MTRFRQLAAIVAAGCFLVAVGTILDVVHAELSVAVLMLVAALTAMVALWSVVLRRGTQVRLRPPTPELARSVPAPGDDLRDAIGEFHDWASSPARPSERTVSGLYGLTVAVLTRFRGLSGDEAAQQLSDGTWTSDPYAAGLLSRRLSVPQPESGLRAWLLGLASSVPLASLRNRLVRLVEVESSYAFALDRTADEVARVSYESTGRSATAPDFETTGAASTDVQPRTTDRSIDAVVEARRHRTGYWNGIGVVALLSTAVGLYAQEAAVVLIGAVGVAFAGAATATSAPSPDLSVTRTLSPDRPEPGDSVRVSVSIENESNSFLPDLRFVDGVPAGLHVVDGPARLGTVLGPHESTTFEYTVEAARGRHQFDPALVITRDPFQSEERAFYVPTAGEIVSNPASRALSRDVSLRPVAGSFGSTIETTNSGDGMAFHSVREYRRGDPLSRIDWNRRARTGELATLEFQQERAASVLLLVDARRAAYVGPDRATPHAVDRAVTACTRLATTLLSEGNLVGLAAIGPTTRSSDGGGANRQCWIGPSSGRNHGRTIRKTLADHPQFSTSIPVGTVHWLSQLRRIRRRLARGTQILFLTPLSDGVGVEIPRRLEAHGYPVTVISPDATTTRATGHRLANVARLIRRFDLQRAGIPVVDWATEETIGQAPSGVVETSVARSLPAGESADGSSRDRSESSDETGSERHTPSERTSSHAAGPSVPSVSDTGDRR